MGKDKNRHTIWLNDDIWKMVGLHYKANNCTTQNEFIEQAIQFYCGYLDTEQEAVFLPVTLSSVLEGSLGALGDRLGKLLFKMSVEMSTLNPSKRFWAASRVQYTHLLLIGRNHHKNRLHYLKRIPICGASLPT